VHLSDCSSILLPSYDISRQRHTPDAFGGGPVLLRLPQRGEPVGRRLLFAGEHTQSARLAYADSALTSGIREAKRLLGTPAVRLAVNHAGTSSAGRSWPVSQA
jgi:hypothetical protein